VLKAVDVEIADVQEAFQYAIDNKWLPKKASINDEIKLQDLSLLLMRSFNLKGGMWYTITKNPHYAFRELVHKDIIQHRASPDMKVTGEQLLFFVNRILADNASAEDK